MIKALLLPLFGGLKGANLGISGATMLLSVALYARTWGWRYATGLIVLIFIHEMGHVLAARQRGLPVSAPSFIPFLGAFVTVRGLRDVETQAYVAIGGPLLGSLGAFACYGAGAWSGDFLLLAIAHTGFVLNLFNLLPVPPLDGGQIIGVLGPRFRIAGLPVLAILLLIREGPIASPIALLAMTQILRASHSTAMAPPGRACYAIPNRKKFEYAALYLGLAATLAIMAYATPGGPGSQTLPSVWYPQSSPR
jgi:Zn-dependent protease